jgi:hypothetical protein
LHEFGGGKGKEAIGRLETSLRAQKKYREYRF